MDDFDLFKQQTGSFEERQNAWADSWEHELNDIPDAQENKKDAVVDDNEQQQQVDIPDAQENKKDDVIVDDLVDELLRQLTTHDNDNMSTFDYHQSLFKNQPNGNYRVVDNRFTQFPVGMCQSYVSLDDIANMDDGKVFLLNNTKKWDNIMNNRAGLNQNCRYGFEMESPFKSHAKFAASYFAVIPSLYYPLLYFDNNDQTWKIDKHLQDSFPQMRVWGQLSPYQDVVNDVLVNQLVIKPPFVPVEGIRIQEANMYRSVGESVFGIDMTQNIETSTAETAAVLPTLRVLSTEPCSPKETTYVSEFVSDRESHPVEWNQEIEVDIPSFLDANEINDITSASVKSKIELSIGAIIQNLLKACQSEKRVWQIHNLCTAVNGLLIGLFESEANNLTYDACLAFVAAILWISTEKSIGPKSKPFFWIEKTPQFVKLVEQRQMVATFPYWMTVFDYCLMQFAFVEENDTMIYDTEHWILFTKIMAIYFDLTNSSMGRITTETLIRTLDIAVNDASGESHDVSQVLKDAVFAINDLMKLKYQLPFFYGSDYSIDKTDKKKMRGDFYIELRRELNRNPSRSKKNTGEKNAKPKAMKFFQAGYDCLDVLSVKSLKWTFDQKYYVPIRDMLFYWRSETTRQGKKDSNNVEKASLNFVFGQTTKIDERIRVQISYTEQQQQESSLVAEELTDEIALLMLNEELKIDTKDQTKPLSLFMMYPSLVEFDTEEVLLEPVVRELPTWDRGLEEFQRRVKIFKSIETSEQIASIMSKNQLDEFRENAEVAKIATAKGFSVFKEGLQTISMGRGDNKYKVKRPVVYLSEYYIRVPIASLVNAILRDSEISTSTYVPAITPPLFRNISQDLDPNVRSIQNTAPHIPEGSKVIVLSAAYLNNFMLRDKSNQKATLKTALALSDAFGKICSLTDTINVILTTGFKRLKKNKKDDIGLTDEFYLFLSSQSRSASRSIYSSIRLIVDDIQTKREKKVSVPKELQPMLRWTKDDKLLLKNILLEVMRDKFTLPFAIFMLDVLKFYESKNNIVILRLMEKVLQEYSRINDKTKITKITDVFQKFIRATDVAYLNSSTGFNLKNHATMLIQALKRTDPFFYVNDAIHITAEKDETEGEDEEVSSTTSVSGETVDECKYRNEINKIYMNVFKRSGKLNKLVRKHDKIDAPQFRQFFIIDISVASSQGIDINERRTVYHARLFEIATMRWWNSANINAKLSGHELGHFVYRNAIEYGSLQGILRAASSSDAELKVPNIFRRLKKYDKVTGVDSLYIRQGLLIDESNSTASRNKNKSDHWITVKYWKYEESEKSEDEPVTVKELYASELAVPIDLGRLQQDNVVVHAAFLHEKDLPSRNDPILQFTVFPTGSVTYGTSPTSSSSSTTKASLSSSSTVVSFIIGDVCILQRLDDS